MASPKPKQKLEDTFFFAFLDPGRRAMLRELVAGSRTISKLATASKVPLSGVSRHIDILRRAGLLATKKQGRVVWCSLVDVIVESERVTFTHPSGLSVTLPR